MLIRTRLLLASTNPGKLKEMWELLSPLKVELVTPEQFGINLQVEENGTTYAQNAAAKALAYARISSLLTLADDSGLEVDALNGLPGIRSARFSPLPGAVDADRRAYLLEQLKHKPRPWSARFVCVVALATPELEVFSAEGMCSGEIIPEERGENGFGYDPIFFIPEIHRTMAEIPDQMKNQISHRSRAIQAAWPTLTKLISSGYGTLPADNNRVS
jgi:XTP/dITP diphosphohydrolase